MDLVAAIVAGGINPAIAGLVVEKMELTGVPKTMALTMLNKETSMKHPNGIVTYGHNIYGHDRGSCFNFPGRNVVVTLENYREYLDCVVRGGKRNGVGPTQLTWIGFQQEADRRGGCWRIDVNLQLGFEILRDHYRKYGVWEAFKRYNGAASYADSSMALMPKWQRIVDGATSGEVLQRGSRGHRVIRLKEMLNEVIG